MLAMCFGTRAGVLLRGAALLWCLRVCLATSPRGQQDQRLSTLRCRLRSALPSFQNPIKIDFSIYRLFDEIDFSIIKNLPGNSTVGNFGQLGADGQLHIIFEQVQNRFHWDKALGGRLFCHSGKTVTPYSLNVRGNDQVRFYRLAVGSRGSKIKTAIFLHY